MRTLTISYLIVGIFSLTFLSCSTQKEMSSVEVIKPPPMAVVKKEEPPAPPPPVEEPEPFRYQTIHFDFDSAEILYRDKEHLDRLAEFLLKNKEVSLTIAGHADERGTFDYNLSLGEQRALNIRQELQRRGIAPERVRIVSYGEERPLVTGRNEEAYSQNRRAEFNEMQ